MEKSIEEANSFHSIDIAEYLRSRKKKVYHDNYFDIPDIESGAGAMLAVFIPPYTYIMEKSL